MSGLEESIKGYQRLVDYIIENSDENGVCHSSELEIAYKLRKSQAWVSKTIKQINIEEVCIYRKNDGYAINFPDISERGTFAIITNLYFLFLTIPEFMKYNEVELARLCNIQRRTIQAAKTYLRTDIRNGNLAFPTKPQNEE